MNNKSDTYLVRQIRKSRISIITALLIASTLHQGIECEIEGNLSEWDKTSHCEGQNLSSSVGPVFNRSGRFSISSLWDDLLQFANDGIQPKRQSSYDYSFQCGRVSRWRYRTSAADTWRKKHNLAARIVGGRQATITEFP